MESPSHILPFVLLVLVLSPSALAFAPTRLFDFVRGKYETGAAKPWDLSFQADAPVIPQTGSRAADLIPRLPGQPRRSPVRQYAGYVTVDAKAGKHMFYYFTEVRANITDLPLVLWLGDCPGCSAVGSAFVEHGTFMVGMGGRIHKNLYSMNTVGNVIYLDSPVGTGFSYSDTPSAHDDVSTAVDNLRFLVNWLERFPQYKSSRLYLGGSGYAGNYAPQLAQLILNYNKAHRRNPIGFTALLLGNPVMDSEMDFLGVYDNIESHGMIKSQMKEDVFNFCNSTSNQPQKCSAARRVVDEVIRPLYLFDLTADVCARPTRAAPLDVDELYECREKDVAAFLNSPEVQKALHVNPAKAPKVWSDCNRQIAENYGDITISTLPIYKSLLANGHVRIFIYSGDADATVPTISTRFSLEKMNLTGGVTWHSWFTSKVEQSGYNVGYGPILLATMRGAGHKVAKTHGRQLATLILLARNGTLLIQNPDL